ncbi:dihydrodipicolinate synthase family protein [Devosia psychrophila]|uniref:4-hydroxy-tetrahydrodipicolinate synthase n=1 Tax=Devosia psychrophila TaxID=728005 RepID=A0A0F5PW45_9HYPH|nr:dihydrodipicolinate synthase family protein [Devosia psychrophila]KKC32606.1 dihydrodipicolinate synthetase [Devosia psychrophila]SFC49649.1 4-hydroxy-tetrahydrodipicolinate synthase [Devosia psychrophila]
MNPATKLPIHGVFCASATPVLEDGTPDHATFASHAKALIDEGCDGIALLGTTGEANSFSIAQRQQLLDKLIAAGLDPKRLLPGTSQTNVADTVTLMRHAVDAGVKATVVLPPFYYKGVSDEGLFRFYAEAIEGVGSNDLRVVLYHIPPIAQVGLSVELVGRLLEAFPGVVVGIKDSSGKLESMQHFASSFADFSVLAGADPFMLPLLRSGGAGCITSSSNLIGKHLRVVFDHAHVPEDAALVDKAQARINAWRDLSNAYVQLPTIKAMLAKRRNHPGWTRVRPPLVELGQTEIDKVWAQMSELEAQENV